VILEDLGLYLSNRVTVTDCERPVIAPGFLRVRRSGYQHCPSELTWASCGFPGL